MTDPDDPDSAGKSTRIRANVVRRGRRSSWPGTQSRMWPIRWSLKSGQHRALLASRSHCGSWPVGPHHKRRI